MITEQSMRHATIFRGRPVLPSNVCAHCGKEDDPESAWEQDNDGDRICSECDEVVLRTLLQEQPREDFERPYFCAVRALRHLKFKNHRFIPLECDGCKEVALFLTEPGYRGDEHNPIGADCERSY